MASVSATSTAVSSAGFPASVTAGAFAFAARFSSRASAFFVRASALAVCRIASRFAWRTASGPAPVGIESSTVAPMTTAATSAKTRPRRPPALRGISPAAPGTAAASCRQSRPKAVSPTGTRAASPSSAVVERPAVSSAAELAGAALPGPVGTTAAGRRSTKRMPKSASPPAASSPLREARLPARVARSRSEAEREPSVLLRVDWWSRVAPSPRTMVARMPPSGWGTICRVPTRASVRASAATNAGWVLSVPSCTTLVPSGRAAIRGAATITRAMTALTAGAIENRGMLRSANTTAPTRPSQARLSPAPGQTFTDWDPTEERNRWVEATAVPRPSNTARNAKLAPRAPGRNSETAASRASGMSSTGTRMDAWTPGSPSISSRGVQPPSSPVGKPSRSCQTETAALGTGAPGSAISASQFPRRPWSQIRGAARASAGRGMPR